MIQKSIFDDTLVIGNSIEDKIVYNPIANKAATFKSGTQKKIHSWFRLTPSFGPDLVDIMLTKLKCKEGEIVLDPFSGASTTLIQSRLRNIASIGFEINPLLHFVGRTSLNWNVDPFVLEAAIIMLEELFNKLAEETKTKDIEECGFEIPKIHNVYRWWRKDVLKDLLILKHIIRTSDLEESYKDFLMLGLAAVLVPDLTNVTLGKLQLHFINRDDEKMNVFDTFKRHLSMMISDLKIIKCEYSDTAIAQLYHVDSTDIKDMRIAERASLVITSPPYPNRYSYVWNTRPHLYFLDIFDNAKQASGLDCNTIGGTWGVATSNLMKGKIEPMFTVIEEVVEPVVSKIRKVDNLMANYVIKYFNLLAKQISEMDKVTTDDVRVAYVVGNSEIKGVYVETDVLLAKIFEGLNLGYQANEVTRFRKRNSGVDLFESIVYASKSR